MNPQNTRKFTEIFDKSEFWLASWERLNSVIKKIFS